MQLRAPGLLEDETKELLQLFRQQRPDRARIAPGKRQERGHRPEHLRAGGVAAEAASLGKSPGELEDPGSRRLVPEIGQDVPDGLFEKEQDSGEAWRKIPKSKQ